MAETDWRRVAALVAIKTNRYCGCFWDEALSDEETAAIKKAVREFEPVFEELHEAWLDSDDD